MLKTIFLLFLLSSTSKCNLLDGIEPVHHGVLLAYFSDPVLQLRHIIQAPIKALLGFLGILFFGGIWEVTRGSDYNYSPEVPAIYNSYASPTVAAITGIKSFGVAGTLAAFWFIVAQILPPLCMDEDGDIVKDQIGSISNGTRCNLSRLVNGREELFSVDTNIHDDEDYNFEDVFIRAVNNIFDTSSIVRDLIITTMHVLSKFIFWGITYELYL